VRFVFRVVQRSGLTPAMDPALLSRIETLRVARRAGATEVGDVSDEELAKWIDVKHFEEIDSTNSYVEREFANFNIAKLTVVSTDSQTAGRGTRGRSWHTAPGHCALLTYFVSFPPECSTEFVNRNAANATQVLALSTVTALQETASARGCKISFGVKWPNDVIADGGKIAGILARAEPSPGPRLDRMILGVGVNINLPESDLDQINGSRTAWPATSLLAAEAAFARNGKLQPPAATTACSVEDFRQCLTMHFAKALKEFFVGGFAAFNDRVHAVDVYVGKKVYFKVSEEHVIRAIYLCLNESGHIVLQHDDGKTSVYPSGEILTEEAVAARQSAEGKSGDDE